MIQINKYTKRIESEIPEYSKTSDNHILFDPINYILFTKGKRIRPALCLMSCGLFDGDVEQAIPAAMCIEFFHNFSLLHDDIMDEAPLRRGKKTAHLKWNINQAILSGDALYALSLQALEKAEGKYLSELLSLFNQTALEVCIGQQLDIEFEQRNDVSIEDYLKMIRLKTSVLLGASLQMGAICAGASEINQKCMYDFGVNLGIAFQLRDDYLDVFGDPETFGKQLGGDILSDKKTYLMLKAIQKGNSNDRALIQSFEGNRTVDSNKVEKILEIYNSLGIKKELNQAIESYSSKAIERLELSSLNAIQKEELRKFANELINRTH